MHRRLLSIAFLLPVALPGCTDGTDVSVPVSSVADSREWDSRCAAEGITGRAYAIAGASYTETELYKVALCPLQVTPLTTGQGVSTFGVRGDDVVLTSSGRGPSFLGRLRPGGAIEPVQGVGEARGANPSIGPGGVIAFISFEKASIYELITYDASTKERRVIVSTPDEITQTAWLADGSLIAGRVTGQRGAELLRFRPDGELDQAHALPIPSIGNLSATPAGLVAVSPLLDPASSGGAVVDVVSGVVVSRLPAPWLVKAWSPDGTRLLMTSESQVGVWTPDRPAEVRVLGRWPVDVVTQMRWVSQ